MDYTPVVPASLGTLGLAAFGINAGTLIVMGVLLIVGIAAFIIRRGFRPGVTAFELAE